MQLVLATSNRHKRDEIIAILEASGIHGLTIRTLRDFPNIGTPVENGATFGENARIKALYASRATGLSSLADDSGLVVDALGGRPGIQSARYVGENASDQERIKKLLAELADTAPSDRTARFVCVMALAVDGRIVAEAEGVCEGTIAASPAGEGGFGYDPVFFLPEYGKTMAEVGAEVKNRISHRARAIHALRDALLRVSTT